MADSTRDPRRANNFCSEQRSTRPLSSGMGINWTALLAAKGLEAPGYLETLQDMRDNPKQSVKLKGSKAPRRYANGHRDTSNQKNTPRTL